MMDNTFTKYRNLFTMLTAVCVCAAINISFKPQNKYTDSNKIKTIVLDAGHGGTDPGCNGNNSVFEKDVTLSVIKKIGKYISDSLTDVKVVYTRNTDVFVKLSERARIANKNSADLFISVHCNSNPNTSPSGSETYFMGLHKTEGNLEVAKRENEVITFESDYKTNEAYGGFDPNSPESEIIFTLVQSAHMVESSKFSSLVEKRGPALSGIHSRGVKQAGFLVLWQTAMPSVLIELGFLTNEQDRNILKTDSGQTKIAQGIFAAICDYKKQRDK